MQTVQGTTGRPEWLTPQHKPLKPISSLGEESGTESETEESLLERWCEGTGGLRVFKTIEVLVVLSAACLIVIDRTSPAALSLSSHLFPSSPACVASRLAVLLVIFGVPTFKARCLRVLGMLLGAMIILVEVEAKAFVVQ
uniref:Uncharacterized protein n=1 Tax=Rhizochromulina marina TaxID=1034831 RepID=A0A7S2SLM3_9STRA